MVHTAASRIEAALQSTPYRNRIVLRGWRLSGPGPARFGWWAVPVCGGAAYLGKSEDSALDFIADQQNRLLVERAERLPD